MLSSICSCFSSCFSGPQEEVAEPLLSASSPHNPFAIFGNNHPDQGNPPPSPPFGGNFPPHAPSPTCVGEFN